MRLPHQLAKLLTLGDGLARIEFKLLRIFVAARGPRSRCPAMHTTPFFP